MSFTMLDLKNDHCTLSEEHNSMMNNNNKFNNNIIGSPTSSGDLSKRCTDCQTTTTPLWRGGPAGPKTLCNACGIKYHKKRRALLGIEKSNKVEKSAKKNKTNHGISDNLGMPLKIKVMASGIKQRESLEVQRAAMLLMALSYGSVYA